MFQHLVEKCLLIVVAEVLMFRPYLGVIVLIEHRCVHQKATESHRQDNDVQGGAESNLGVVFLSFSCSIRPKGYCKAKHKKRRHNHFSFKLNM
jgi:hypothetical protein